MKIELHLSAYSPATGLPILWEDHFEITSHFAGEAVVIRANPEGLRSLGKLFLSLAQEDVPVGYHCHLDEHNSLENGSLELIIERA